MNKNINLDAWDQRIAPRLQDLEYYGNSIARCSRGIAMAVGSLPVRPAWETKAMESLDAAERDLRVALAVIKTAKEQYGNLPVMAEAAE